MKRRRISKILIANRGEIAVRIIRTIRDMGLQSVAVFSLADRLAVHTRLADEAYPIGGPDPATSYLDAEKILEVARQSGADAIHPGYGFLSENAGFAEAVEKSGLVFIGPRSHTIGMMGDKLKAKNLAVQAGIPVVPGYESALSDEADALQKALEIGFPVLIKASAGGGGKGMRIVHREEELSESIGLARHEARDAFGDDSVFIEKFIENPRHIEVQVLSDAFGNHRHLFERDCSVQRRHQKLVEESPSPFVTDKLRKKLTDSALALTQACDYLNAGTVEFIVDPQGNHYFLEMNTRLQVEHPVTELITGIDLVNEQIRIASGERITWDQKDIELKGHALELRVYAEDPDNGFLPASGKLDLYKPPMGPGIRIDDGYEEDQEIPVYYDALIAKIIISGNDRSAVIRKFNRALREFHISPVPTTLSFGRWLGLHEPFIQGNYHTGLIGTSFRPESGKPPEEDQATLAAAVSARELKKIRDRHKKPVSGQNKINRWKQRRR